jgi:hypothetical protein
MRNDEVSEDKLTKKQKQKIWDEILIDQWQKDGSVIIATTLFLREVEPSLLNPNGFIMDGGITAVCEYMISTGLHRCLDANGDSLYFNCRGPVRAFIAARCDKINNILWSEKYTSELVLAALPQFKWRKQVKAVLKNIAERRRAEAMMGQASLVIIDARARDKKHSWNTVK